MSGSSIKVAPRAIGLAPLTVRLAEWEPAWAILNRLAVRRGQPDACAYIQRIRNCPTWVAGEVARGRCLEVIADLSGVPLRDIERWTPHVTEQGTVLGSALVTATDRFNNGVRLGTGRGVVCPACLIEDRETRGGPEECRGYRRSWWTIADFQACPVHQHLLLSRCPGCDARQHRINVRPDLCSCGHDLARVAPEKAVQGLEQDLLAIIVGSDPPDWGVGLSLRAMSNLALRVGVVQERGPSVKSVESMERQEHMELSKRGWRLLGDGPDSFATLLGRSIAAGGSRSPQLAYGELYRWLARANEPGLERYREALLAHALENLRPVEDKKVFGVIVPGRPIVRVVRRHCDLGGSPGELCELLGINRAQLVRLLAADGSYRFPGKRGRYDLEETARFLERVRRSAPELDHVPEGMMRVMDSGAIERRWPTTVAAIRRGDLKVAGRLRGRVGLAALVASVRAIYEALPIRREEPEPAHTCSAAARLLNVRRETLTALRRGGFLTYVPCLWRADQLTIGPSSASLDQFRTLFISGLELATVYGRGLRSLCRILEQRGVRSVIDYGRNVTPIFEKALVREVLGPAPESHVSLIAAKPLDS